MRDYAITGMGLHNRLGSNTKDSWINLINRISAIHRIDTTTHYRFTNNSNGIENIKLASLLSDESDFDYYEVCMNVVDEIIAGQEIENNTATVLSTGPLSYKDQSWAYDQILGGKKKVSVKKILAGDSNFLGFLLAKKYNFTGLSINIDQLCVTTIMSIHSAIAHMEMNHDIPAFLLLNCSFINPLAVFGLNTFRALSLSDNPADIKPFDKDRNGIAVSDCVGGLMIEPLDYAIKKQKNILGIIKGIASNMIADSPTSPDPDGKGILFAMQSALKMSGLNANDITYVNAHATGTPAGDHLELNSILSLFPHANVVSNKGQIGHGIISGGIAEIIYTIMSMNMGVFAGNFNLENPCNDSSLLPKDNFKHDCKYAMKNSLAFGGRNCSIVLGASE